MKTMIRESYRNAGGFWGIVALLAVVCIGFHGDAAFGAFVLIGTAATVTKIADVIQPAVWSPYMIQR